MFIYKYYTIYQITNLLNGKQYIGCHKTNSFKSKRTQDYNQKYSSNTKLDSDLKEYGKHNFIREWLFIFDNEKDMLNKEHELVNEEWYKSNMTYNETRGGGNPPNPKGIKRSQQHQKRLNESKKGKKRTEKTKQKIRKTLQEKCCGEKNANVKFTNEEIQEIRQDPRLWKRGGVTEIAIERGVHQSTISSIKMRRIWKHI